MPYAYLMLAVVALGLLGVLHKVADFRGCRPEAINLFLFLAAACLMWLAVFVRFRTGMGLPAALVGVAAVCGFLASLAILNFQRGVRYGKISTSWLIINLSTALPTALSILIYHERLSPRRAFGLVLAMVALLILWLERRHEEQETLTPVAEGHARG